MRKLKIRFLNRVNIIIGTLIAMLGIGCKPHKAVTKTEKVDANNESDELVETKRNREVVCMYGVPRAEVAVEGRVTSKDGNPIEGVSVSLKAGENIIGDAQTDAQGEYKIFSSIFPTDTVSLVVTDETGRFKPYEQDLPMHYSGGVNAFDYGSSSEVVNVVLMPARQDRLLKYGVPTVDLKE